MSTGYWEDRGRWRWVVLAIWLLVCASLLHDRWTTIQWFALSDTDDNLRMSQVRAWLGGQGWFDLRQYKLDPPGGANIHWSRLVDMPIAGIILLLRPLVGGVIAEKSAVALAPLIPLGVALFAMAVTARRAIDLRAFAIGALVLLGGTNALGMWSPLRIDHHGWQLAMLAVAVAGWADPQGRRGGLTIGVASALSLAIGLELLPMLGLLGAFVVLRWVADPAQAERMRAYGLSLAAGSGIGFLLFASIANRGAVCDALSPVWLSVTLGGGGLVVALSYLRAGGLPLRLGAALLVAALVGGAFALSFPDCLSRPEGVSPELQRLWLDKVREARPIYTHNSRLIASVTLPIALGLIGYALMLWRERGTARWPVWAGLAALGLASATLLLWQTRAGPSAQLLAAPGAAGLAWALVMWARRSRTMLVRAALPVLIVFVGAGFATQRLIQLLPADPQSALRKTVSRADRRCPTLPALKPIAALPPATILTFVDFGPRLITVTHHRAIAGPYHRNQQAILDIHHAFRGSAETAHEVMARHGATLLLLCPGMSESTIYRAEARQGFYVQLMKGQVPAWLQPVPLPKGSPFKLWRRIE